MVSTNGRKWCVRPWRIELPVVLRSLAFANSWGSAPVATLTLAQNRATRLPQYRHRFRTRKKGERLDDAVRVDALVAEHQPE